VSGQHFPLFKAPTLSGHQSRIVHFCQLFRCIHLEQELQGHLTVATAAGEEEGKLLGYEGIDLNDYFGKEDKNIDKTTMTTMRWAVNLPLLLMVVLVVYLPPLQDTPRQGL
jgi:hypothetical protein